MPKKSFTRGQNGLTARRNFTRSGVIGVRDEALTKKQIQALHDDDIAALILQGVIESTDTVPRTRPTEEGRTDPNPPPGKTTITDEATP